MEKKYIVAMMLGVAFITALVSIISFNKKTETVRYDKKYIWSAEYDTAETETIVRGKNIDHIKHDVDKLVLALNKATEEAETARPHGEGIKTEFPRVALQKVEQQTAFIEVANDEYLTQAMGSSGAQDYLAEVTYTLTENPWIKAVNFAFNAGEHAMPGLYSRASFSYKVIDGKKS